MGLFGSRKESREQETKEGAVELLHITLVKSGISDDIMEKVERGSFGVSFKDLLAKGRVPRLVITDENGEQWSALGRIS